MGETRHTDTADAYEKYILFSLQSSRDPLCSKAGIFYRHIFLLLHKITQFINTIPDFTRFY
jgi:hypothetical protein